MLFALDVHGDSHDDASLQSVFAAYTTIQFYSASTYGSSLAADCVSAVYLTFTATCLISPSIINKYGCRFSMFFGVLGYASLVLASLIYFLYGGENVTWARRLVVAGGAVLGCGASTLWTAQGRLILQYASRAEQLETPMEPTDPAEKRNGKSQTGKLMGLFWAIFQCSSLVGGSISFLYYNKKPEGSAALYSLFLAFILMGAVFTQLLLPPSMLRRGDDSKSKVGTRGEFDVEMTSEKTPLTVDPSSEYSRGESQMSEDLSNQSWIQEARDTVKMVLNREMMCLSLLFFYTVSSDV